jgi:hypothetical protein
MEKIRFYCAQEILDNGGQNWWKQLKLIWKIGQTSILSTKTLTEQRRFLMLIWSLEQDFIEIKQPNK